MRRAGSDFGGHLLRGGFITARDDNARPALAKPFGNPATDAARAAGNENNLVGDVEERIEHTRDASTKIHVRKRTGRSETLPDSERDGKP
jgi:hypothetical protein